MKRRQKRFITAMIAIGVISILVLQMIWRRPKSYDDIPSYYFDNNYLDKKIDSIPEGKSFIFITDTHWLLNAQHSTSLIQYVRDHTKAHKVIFGGDILIRDKTKDIAQNNMEDYLFKQVDAFGEDYLPAFGNHDSNLANAEGKGDLDEMRMEWQTVSELFVGHLEDVAVFEDISLLLDQLGAEGKDREDLIAYSKLHYYVDDEEDHIRYIVLNTGSPDNFLTKTYTGVQNLSEMYLQMDWMYDVLMSTPDGYDVVAIGHETNYKPSDSPILGYHMRGLWGQLSAISQKKVATLYVSASEEKKLDSWIERKVHSYDFSNAPDLGKIVVLGAHNHIDYFLKCYFNNDSFDSDDYIAEKLQANGDVVYQSNGEIPIIHTQCDAYGTTDSKDCYEMNTGSITEQCFDVITLTDDGIKLTRFGAGDDRALYIK